MHEILVSLVSRLPVASRLYINEVAVALVLVV